MALGDRLAKKQPRGRDYPKRRGVAQHDGAPGRNELDADCDQCREGDHMGKGDAEHDRKVASPRQDQIAGAPQKTKQHDCRDQAAQHRGPQRRNTVNDHLGHGPAAPPGENDDDKQQQCDMPR